MFWPPTPLAHAISHFQKKTSIWNKEVFGNIFRKIKEILARIRGIQKSPHYPHSSFLHNLEPDLLSEYDNMLYYEEIFWKTKSKISWLTEGDANTRFFHVSTINRRRKNRIHLLRDEVGNEFLSQEDIRNHTTSFFTKLYTTEHVASKKRCPNPTPNPNNLDHLTKAHLDRALEEADIFRAIASFKPLKAPGPDGIHPLFYQKFWPHVKDKVLSFCKLTFETCKMDPQMNTTLLCLIPKCRNATTPRNFRPIGLCNTIYKLIIKIITLRLKDYLNTIIGPSQASFLPGRRTSDNAIIVQDYINHFRKMKEKVANMILKIALEKAIDRLEWSFFKNTLKYFNLPLSYPSSSYPASLPSPSLLL